VLHFGRDGTHIPGPEIEKIHAAHPEIQIFVYENAGHAFNREASPGYNASAAREARRRTIDFLNKHLG
jgi:carboxymethylenebutenolidase